MVETLVYIVTTVVTYILGLISKKLKWNEDLPIPVQNIIIGIITFVILYFIKKPQDIEVLMQQIITAIGGVSTAALCYDASKIKKEDK